MKDKPLYEGYIHIIGEEDSIIELTSVMKDEKVKLLKNETYRVSISKYNPKCYFIANPLGGVGGTVMRSQLQLLFVACKRDKNVGKLLTSLSSWNQSQFEDYIDIVKEIETRQK